MSEPKIIIVPSSPFEFGDKRFRSLYGPESPSGERPLVGVIDEDYVSALEAELEKAMAIRE